MDCLNKTSAYIEEVYIDLCGNAETAQITVNKMNNRLSIVNKTHVHGLQEKHLTSQKQ